ncbi:MAG: hypothetical protein ABEJ66_03410, partial [Candidatus Nanohaloarchaea archaeon]
MMELRASDRFIQPLLPAAEKLRKLVPNIQKDLTRARMEVDSDIFLASALLRGIQVGGTLTLALVLFGAVNGKNQIILGAVVGAPLLAFFGFLT